MSISLLFSTWWGASQAAWILLGVVLDILFGDPPWQFHPVHLIGLLVERLEAVARMVAHSPRQLRLAGMGLTLFVMVLVLGFVTVLLMAAHLISIWLFRLLIVLLTYWGVAVRGLAEAALAVYRPLAQGKWNEARYYLSMIVGRDTEKLSESEMIRATIETVAENTCDSIVAPLLFTFIGGPAWLWLYKAVNTMDSMIGHRTAEYQDLGWFAARTDDWFNWIPARISGAAIALTAGVDGRLHQAFQVMRADGRRHPSPNSGISEAAMAGALGVSLGGVNSYQGVVSLRPKIGQSDRALSVPMIIQAVSIIMRVTLVVSLALGFVAFMATGRWLS